MIREEPEEIKKLKELSKKYKGCRCSQYCSVWNSEDRDCEIMGEHHLSPSRCLWFLMQELRGEVSEMIDEEIEVPTCESIKIGCSKDYYED